MNRSLLTSAFKESVKDEIRIFLFQIFSMQHLYFLSLSIFNDKQKSFFADFFLQKPKIINESAHWQVYKKLYVTIKRIILLNNDLMSQIT